MVDEKKVALPVFTSPSGSALDELLLSLLNSVAGSINSKRTVAISVTAIDDDLSFSESRIICSPLLGPTLAENLRRVAQDIEDKEAVKSTVPQSNRSTALH